MSFRTEPPLIWPIWITLCFSSTQSFKPTFSPPTHTHTHFFSTEPVRVSMVMLAFANWYSWIFCWFTDAFFSPRNWIPMGKVLLGQMLLTLTSFTCYLSFILNAKFFLIWFNFLGCFFLLFFVAILQMKCLSIYLSLHLHFPTFYIFPGSFEFSACISNLRDRPHPFCRSLVLISLLNPSCLPAVTLLLPLTAISIYFNITEGPTSSASDYFQFQIYASRSPLPKLTFFFWDTPACLQQH